MAFCKFRVMDRCTKMCIRDRTNYEAVDAAFETEVVPYEVFYFSRGAENDRVWGRIGAHVFCYGYVWTA